MVLGSVDLWEIKLRETPWKESHPFEMGMVGSMGYVRRSPMWLKLVYIACILILLAKTLDLKNVRTRVLVNWAALVLVTAICIALPLRAMQFAHWFRNRFSRAPCPTRRLLRYMLQC